MVPVIAMIAMIAMMPVISVMPVIAVIAVIAVARIGVVSVSRMLVQQAVHVESVNGPHEDAPAGDDRRRKLDRRPIGLIRGVRAAVEQLVAQVGGVVSVENLRTA